jgi:hypothetical protein
MDSATVTAPRSLRDAPATTIAAQPARCLHPSTRNLRRPHGATPSQRRHRHTFSRWPSIIFDFGHAHPCPRIRAPASARAAFRPHHRRSHAGPLNAGTAFSATTSRHVTRTASRTASRTSPQRSAGSPEPRPRRGGSSERSARILADARMVRVRRLLVHR